MKIFTHLLTLALTTGSTVYADTVVPFTTSQERYSYYVNAVLETRGPNECNSDNVQVRREWGVLSKQGRLDYIAAVKCLANLPAKTRLDIAPGARTHYDDFLAQHILQAPFVHFTGLLLPFHRTLVWEYEQALRNECGYTGAQPYWDWPLYYDNLTASPLFDGSDTSLGGNGEYIPHGPTPVSAFGLNVNLPPGTGGGDVTTGAFAYWTVNLGNTPPLSPPATNTTILPAPDVLATANGTDLENLRYNPRNLTRDFQYEQSSHMTFCDEEHLLSCADFDCFLKRIDGWEAGDPNLYGLAPSLHPNGHFTMGGLQNDPFVSPGDPSFYFHHAQLDRMWAIWQAQDPRNRQYAVGGTRIHLILTSPIATTHEPVTPDDLINFGVIGETIPIKAALNTISGKFCYIYE